MNKLKIIGFIILSILFVSASNTSIELETKSLLNDQIELKIPKDFKIMSEEMIKLKYPPEKPPTLVYTDERGEINVAFNLTTSKAEQGLLLSYKDYFIKAMKDRYPSAKWKSDGIAEINGRKVAYLEMITPGIDTKIYNLMFFTDVDGKLLLCTFNCTQSSMKEWSAAAKEIMYSLKVK